MDLFVITLFIGSTDQKSEPIDVFISCSPRDDGWVRENMIRVLANLPHSLAIQLNRYDSPTESNMIMNAKILTDSPVVIAVCSKHYSADPTGRLRYERELAYRYGIKMIPVMLPNCSVPSDIYDVEPIYVGETVNGLPGWAFYEVLLTEIVGSDPLHTKGK